MKFLKKIGCALSLLLLLVPCMNIHATDVTEDPSVGNVTILPEEDLTKVPENGLGSISVELTDAYDIYSSKEKCKFGIVRLQTLLRENMS